VGVPWSPLHQGLRRPPVALLLPGLVRSYAHGAHWRRFVASLAAAYEVRVYLCVWSITGAPGNNFAQAADKAAAAPVDTARLTSSFPSAMGVRLVEAREHWIARDAEGFDGRYLNQWAMVQKCWELMEEVEGDAVSAAVSFERSRYVIRARPDLRIHALPMSLERADGLQYVALQERLWGSDNFFFGDAASMQQICCGVAPRYEHYTRLLGHASSEPMLERHLQSTGLEARIVRFTRCVSVDRS